MKKIQNIMQVGEITMTPEARSQYLTLELQGKKTRIHYKELWGAMFVLGGGKYREQMIPVQKKERMIFSRKHTVRAARDIKAGEQVVFWCEVDVAKTVVDAIAKKNGAMVIEQVEPLSTGIVKDAAESVVH